jgi:hypothetical protein
LGAHRDRVAADFSSVPLGAASMNVIALTNRAADSLEVFRERAFARALLVREGVMEFHDAVDGLQDCAVAFGLIGRFGQDKIQAIMSEAFGADTAQLESTVNDILRRMEMQDSRDSWRHTGEAPPPASVRNSDINGPPEAKPKPNKTPDATIAAFRHLLSLDDPEALKKWLADHPRDASFLKQLWRRNAFAR